VNWKGKQTKAPELLRPHTWYCLIEPRNFPLNYIKGIYILYSHIVNNDDIPNIEIGAKVVEFSARNTNKHKILKFR
jgi:hypothetical protein